jgi:hypothetical protein
MLFLPTQKAQLYVFYTQRYCSFVSCAVVLRKQKKFKQKKTIVVSSTGDSRKANRVGVK